MQSSIEKKARSPSIARAHAESAAGYGENVPVRVAGAGTPGATPSYDLYVPEHPGFARDVRAADLYRRMGKRFLDVSLVLLTLPVSVPLIAIAALALWIESGFPFYRQKRLGRGGRAFSMFKLRTMSRDAEQQLRDILATDAELRREWHFTQKLKCDPRITRVGGFLRRTSIDELPQVWNVLRGDMSLVGPRPMMPDQLNLYGDARAYFALQPGLSGFWQVSERNESHFSYRADVDKSYLGRVSLWVDISVLWKTIFVVFRRTGY